LVLVATRGGSACSTTASSSNDAPVAWLTITA